MTRRHLITHTVVLSMVFILLASSLLSVSFLFPTPYTETRIQGSEQNERDTETRSPVYAPQIVCDENTTKSAYPMDIVVFNCTVRNLGNVTDDYEVLTTPIRGWNVIPEPNEFDEIPPQDSNASDAEKNRSLVLQVVTGDLYNATVGKYFIDVTIRSNQSPSNRSTVTLTVEVLLFCSLDIFSIDGPYYNESEDYYLYELYVQNVGNGNALFDIWVEGGDERWEVRLLDDSQGTVWIQHGGIVPIQVVVVFLEEMVSGTCMIVTICAKPHDEPNASTVRGFFQIYAPYSSSPFRMWIWDDWEQTGKLEDTLTFTVDVTFNKEVDGVTFLMSEQPPGWSVELDTSELPESGQVKDLEYHIYVKVSIPHSTPIGQYNFTLDGYVTGPPLKWVDCAIFYVDVLPTYGAEMVFNESEKTTAEEAKTKYSALLTNTGNIECSYNWTLSCHNVSWIDITNGECTVAPGGMREITFNILPPLYTLPDSYEFKFRLHSNNDRNISIERIFRLNVVERLDFIFVPEDYTYYVNPAEEKFIDIEVMNTGNANVTISFDVFGESWAILTQKNLFIPYLETEKLSLRIVTGENATPGKYSFKVSGQITTEPYTIKNTSQIIIIPTFEFACSDIYITDRIHGLPLSGYIGEAVSFHLEIFNTGEQYYDLHDHGANLSVTILLGDEPLHSVEIPHLDAGSSVWVNFSHTFHTEGTFQLYAEINAEHRLCESNYTNNDAGGEITILARGTEEDNGDPGDDDTFFSRKMSDILTIVLIIFVAFIIITGAVILVKRRYPPEL